MSKLIFSEFCETVEEVHIGDLILEQGEYTTGHRHNFFEVFIVIEGSFVHICNSEQTILSKGMGRFICPRDSHYFRAGSKDGRDVLRNIAIHPRVFKRLMTKSKYVIQKEFFETFEVDEHLLYQFCYKTSKLVEEVDIAYRMYLTESLISDLTIFVFDDYQKQKNIPKWLQNVYDEMQQVEYMIEGLPKLLELSVRSQEHVTRAFNKYYNQTPTDYINELRLKESARLLIQTDWLIIAIAEKCGFNTLTYYNKIFKKYYGVTPSEYRRKNKKSLF